MGQKKGEMKGKEGVAKDFWHLCDSSIVHTEHQGRDVPSQMAVGIDFWELEVVEAASRE